MVNERICANCEYCRFPRSENDNNGNCKCRIMKNKTIVVCVCEGQTPQWCPLKKKGSEIKNVIEEINKRYSEMIDGKRTLCIADYHEFVVRQLEKLEQALKQMGE